MFKFLHLMVLILTLLISACASQKVANSDELESTALADAASIDLSPEEMIQRASQRLNSADQDLRFYSPLHMQKAEEELEQARKLLQSSKKDAKTSALAAAILTEKLVKQAEENREVVKQQLSLALAHRDILLELGAPELVPSEFTDAMSDLKDLIILVESGQLDAVAKKQPKLLAEFSRVEASTLKVKWLNRAIAKLAESEAAEAEKYAPKAFEQASFAIQQADAYTDSNYRDRVGVKARADEAFVLASKALNMSGEVQKVFEKKISEIENYMQDVQSWLAHINQETGVIDLQALTFYDQSQQIAEAISKAKTNSPEPPQPEAIDAAQASDDKKPEDYVEPELLIKPMEIQ